MADYFYSIAGNGEGMYRDRGSKFIGLALPVETEADIANAILEAKKNYHDARHHCFAYIIGKEGEFSKASDDGEPSHSAGDPILGQIRSRELSNTLVIVVRYFGGTKLGVGGLINAYKEAASLALDNAKRLKNYNSVTSQIEFRYENTSHIQKLMHDFDLKTTKEEYVEVCKFTIAIPISMADSWKKAVVELNDRGILSAFSFI